MHKYVPEKLCRLQLFSLSKWDLLPVTDEEDLVRSAGDFRVPVNDHIHKLRVQLNRVANSLQLV